MRLLLRLVVLAGLLGLCVWLFREGKRVEAQGLDDQTKLLVYFGGALITAMAAGIIIAITFLPVLGEKLGDLIYGGSDSAPDDPFVKARESIEAGEYLEAISFYRQALAGNPDDTAAIEGIANVQMKHLGDPQAAVETLTNALQKQWPVDEQAFLRCKLAEVYGRNGDMATARTLLTENMQAWPGTAQARNAEHLLHELEAS
ncbi:MAG TPA: tetratricopeptide repeat protein [Chthoniobacterales bacterium]|jgi:tetratricopeptide (TPR) repeat protein